ncbi:glycosyltransferase family 2 protein [Roseococcus sp. YIM B11640]|uniref:glycosyltransferase family 2 protein n=1 Tax=Roseococcus sp. YIM B11640 TaxID=3133973 RepID=UPI003C7E66BA
MSGEAPRFSILLPTHNRADVLGFAIESVLAQTEPDFELLVVADGCTDATSEVVARFGDPRIRFFDLPKAPFFGYANRNLALREAKGRLVAFAAHDDLLLPDHLELMGALMDREGCAWAYSRPLWVSTDGVVVPFATDLRVPGQMREFQERNSIPAAGIVHTRAALEQAGFWPEDVPSAADWILWRRMLAIDTRPPGFLRTPTNLHFVANWKRSRFSASPEVEMLLRVADGVEWWPAILRHPPVQELEQATLWRAMRAGGEGWVEEFRAAVEDVLDRIAWMAIRETMPGRDAAKGAALEAAAREAAALAAAEAADLREAQARAEVAAMSERERASADREKYAGEVAAAALRGESAARAEIDAGLKREAAALQRLEMSRQEAEALRASTSWRITAPLRSLARCLRPRG